MSTRRFLVTGGLLALAGCAGPRPAIPESAKIAPPPAWRAADGMVAPASDLDPQWWRAFGDPALQALVDEGLRANDDLAIAAARVEQARAQFAAARGSQAPQANGVIGGGRSRSLNAFGIDTDQWSGQAEVQASFDLDLFGRLRNSTAAARAQLLATQYGRDGTRLAIASTVASGYIQLLASDARLDVLRRTLTFRAASLKLNRRRAEAGYASQLDLAQAEAEYQAAAQQIPTVELAISKQENALSILVGRVPGPIVRGVGLGALSVPAVPAALPAAVLRRRPDLAAAEQQIVAADRSLDSARAAFMPGVSLTASGGFVGTSLLSDNPFSVFSLGGSILAPLFNGGRIRAQAEGAAAQRDQAAFSYRKSALTAFREVEDGMASIDRLGEQERALAAQRDALAKSRGLAAGRYREGYSPYLELLDAERGLLSAELSLVQSRSDRLVAAVGLYQALGGGWQPQAGS